ncbi:methionyl-tRNA synthetase [Candidatus Electrothrix communis]|uniref:Methionine--tRNA ligase n=1 Tax=Candidatus Electrothrix communis TaxID=1859133 RepID=A0A3S4TGA6_9BACT|nr:methionyl-tRNA synthetase [Candidatus Electrothrix communis]WLE96175.1 MAG: methionine--tRNA ligase [Candidatus Electrothrix communis]
MTTYITTPIYYVNAMPHIGHAYTTIIADTYSRFRRLCGDEVRFQTGTDEHGEKIVQAAEGEGISPREYVDRISDSFRQTWPGLDIAPDHFIRTTDADHIKLVQDILQKVYDQGDIYFSEYSGHYCKGCERFLTEKELVDGKCPDHQTVPEEISEQNYFFRMSKYQDWLIDHIKSNPEYITPERYRNEVLSFLSEPLEDLCISRPCSRLTWGIPLPFDKNFVTYVWFDALINYLTGIGYPNGPDFDKHWSVAEHVIAKDILKPHAIYWPTMLQSMGVAPYKRLHVHGYWNVDETKMSKSIGNVIRPGELVEEYGVDTVRYFLLREMSFGRDSSFSTEALESRRNSDLANDVGNLFSRALTMLAKYADSIVPEIDKATVTDEDRVLVDALEKMVADYTTAMNAFEFHKALQSIWEVIGMLNRFIVTNAPWELAKDPDQAGRLNTVLYFLADSLRLLALVLRPVMPTAADKMAAALGQEKELAKATLEEEGCWGSMQAGTVLHQGEALFPRLEKKKKQQPQTQGKEQSKKGKAKKKEAEPEIDMEGLITFEQFGEVELRVAEIVTAEKIKKANKLLKLTVKAPEERTLVAGIALHYSPEDLVGKKVIIVANLKPAKLMGITSQGMVLAAKETDADGNERLVLSTVAGDIAPGSRVA